MFIGYLCRCHVSNAHISAANLVLCLHWINWMKRAPIHAVVWRQPIDFHSIDAIVAETILRPHLNFISLVRRLRQTGGRPCGEKGDECHIILIIIINNSMQWP